MTETVDEFFRTNRGAGQLESAIQGIPRRKQIVCIGSLDSWLASILFLCLFNLSLLCCAALGAAPHHFIDRVLLLEVEIHTRGGPQILYRFRFCAGASLAV